VSSDGVSSTFGTGVELPSDAFSVDEVGGTGVAVDGLAGVETDDGVDDFALVSFFGGGLGRKRARSSC